MPVYSVGTRLRIMKLLTENNMNSCSKQTPQPGRNLHMFLNQGGRGGGVSGTPAKYKFESNSCSLKSESLSILRFGKASVDQVQRHILAGSGLQGRDDRNKLRAHSVFSSHLRKVGRAWGEEVSLAKKVPPCSRRRRLFAEYSRKSPMNRPFSSCSI